MIHLCAFVPMYDPITAIFPELSAYWLWFSIPLALAISVVYKGTRVEKLKTLPGEAAIMTAQLLFVMVLAAAVLAAGYWGYVRIVGPWPQ